LPAFRARTAQDLRLGPYERDWACALAVALVNHGWFRVGSERHTRASRTYGITTLTKRHVSLAGNDVELRFRTKNKKLVRKKVNSPSLARGLRSLVGLENGARLFRFEQDGEILNLTARMLNEYIAEHFGNGFTAKDFRTWGGTLLAAAELAKRGPPAGEAEAKRVLANVMRKVAQELGNTPAVARTSYVSPAVVEHYLAGSTIEDFRSKTPRPARLRSDERALLRLLRSDAHRNGPGSRSKSRAQSSS
jgi:DNA topoisomerase-1